jgi:non-ribosomal peptide synthetase component E (peptide arylation enzyme)
LRERGVRKGDRVAVSLGNNWEFATLTYALFKLGAILVRSSLVDGKVLEVGIWGIEMEVDMRANEQNRSL